MSLRLRLVVGMVLLAIVLAGAAVAITRTTERNLIAQIDTQLAAAGPLRRPRALATPPRASAITPPTFPVRPASDTVERLSPVYLAFVADGNLQTVFTPNLNEDVGLPDLDLDEVRAKARTGAPFTVDAIGSDHQFRVLAHGDPETDAVTVVALSLADVEEAVDRLVAVEFAATVAALAVLGAVTWWVIQLGVQPVKEMTATAVAIAGGDLSRRVPVGRSRNPDVDDLAAALNVMLGRIESSFAERAASEERLRQFIADASHELRTPVATIRGYAELFRGGGLEQPDDLTGAMRRTEEEAIRMGSLIDDMLLLARLDQGRPLEDVPIDVATLVDDAARDARARDPERNITVAAEAPLVVRGDTDRLRQVIANVVGNALVHTPPGTPIEITAAVLGETAAICVSDHGPGMSEEHAARAFERFYRADPSRSRHRGGSGLGLAIVKSAVHALGGTVTLDSTPGVGTCICLRLPLAFRKDDLSANSQPGLG